MKAIKYLSLAALALVFASFTAPSGSTGTEKRTSVHAMRNQTLKELYSTKPDSRQLVANSAGYAVFNQVETKIPTAGTSNGYGLAVNKSTGRETYMRMAGLSAGFGAFCAKEP